MTVREAAQALGCHPSTVRRWIQRGKLKATQVDEPFGPTYIIQPRDVQAFLTDETPGRKPRDASDASQSGSGSGAVVEGRLLQRIAACQAAIDTLAATQQELQEKVERILNILELQEDAHRKSRDEQLTSILKTIQELKHPRSARRLIWR
nr:helix-turn-helix domain-containing protein [Alicyclobacillus shizuokensis]